MSRGRAVSPNLALNELVARSGRGDRPLVHLGFGEARLPVLASLRARLAAGARHHGYGPVAGSPAARAAVAGYFTRRGIPTTPGQIVVGPGSKPLLMALHLAVPGDVVLPVPCWNSYPAQADMAGRKVIGVPIPAEYGGVPDPLALRDRIRAARVAGHDPRILILTLPDNPTGTFAPREAVRSVCGVAEDEDLLVVSDEIYRDTVHDPAHRLFSPAEVIPERTIVTTGLSKSLAIGGWRIGAARFPEGPRGRRVRDTVVAVASDVWSSLAGPMQEVAEYAFGDPPEIRRRLRDSARLHGAVAREVHALMVRAGALCRPPTGAFYVYPDLEPLRPRLARRGVTDSDTLRRHLFDRYGLVVLAGHHLGDHPEALRFKAATSMLYGETEEEQEEALSAADPLRLPHISGILTRIEESFADLNPAHDERTG
ncbi:aminotransferase, class I and II [Streptomyces lincolnensis]|uniref:Aminotransferase n=1 Tax=Streptomyces lincolnensis TaxID=1915 RepID=A0A1B1MPR3_STRLN|nr:pyridoxal phosphate-dependent aminotransferase [Streptomyces lincolnensis]ANS70543.1 aminotransferase, class I and II [Streptomyces lincolnensis]